MTIALLFPFFDTADLIKVYQLNQAFKAVLTPGDAKCLNFEVLFDKWIPSLAWTPDEIWRQNLENALS